MKEPVRVEARRYVQPLREGGSLPAVVDTERGLVVVKFRGAGQGAKALVAELIVGMIAERVGLPVPELAIVEIGEDFGRTEPDPEIQDILEGSRGVNVGLRYLDGAFNFQEAPAGELVTAELAARVVWLDAFLTNPDRTARNPNLLVWKRTLWLIDHGAALYAHHAWDRVDRQRTRGGFPPIRDHVLLERSGDLTAADERMAEALDETAFEEIMRAVPGDLLVGSPAGDDFASADEARARYVRYLTERLEAPRAFVEEADRARAVRLGSPRERLSARR